MRISHRNGFQDITLREILSLEDPDELILVATTGELTQLSLDISHPIHFIPLPPDTAAAKQRMKEILAGEY